MKKLRILSAFLALTLLLGACGKKETDNTDDNDSDSTKKTTATGVDTEDTTGTTTGGTPFSGEIEAPGDAVIDGLKTKFQNENNVYLVLNDAGQYDIESYDSAMLPYQAYLAEYIFSEEYFNIIVESQGIGAYTTYDQYVQDMAKAAPTMAAMLDSNFKLKELPSDRIVFAVTCQNESRELKQNDELVEKLIREGLNMLFEDPACKDFMSSCITENQVHYDYPYFYALSFVYNYDSSAYVVAAAISVDSAHYYLNSKFVALNGEDPDLMTSGITLRAPGPGGYDPSVLLPADSEEAKNLLSDVHRFADTYGRTKGSWSEGSLNELLSTTPAELTLNADDAIRTSLSYCGNNNWFYSDLLTGDETFTVEDQEENDAMLRTLQEYFFGNAFTACIDLSPSIPGTWRTDPSATYTESRLNPVDKDCNAMTIVTFMGEKEYQLTSLCFGPDSIYYCDDHVVETDAVVDGVPYYETTAYYEFFGQNGEYYYRMDTTPVFLPIAADGLNGQRPLRVMSEILNSEYEFEIGYEVLFEEDPDLIEKDGLWGANRTPVCCEYYKKTDGSSTIAVLINSDGHILCGWEDFGQTLSIYYAICEATAPTDVSELIDFAKEANGSGGSGSGSGSTLPADSGNYSAVDWIRYDSEENGFDDMTVEIVEGEEITGGSPVVQGYLDYFSSLQPFTLSMYTFGDYKISIQTISNNADLDFFEEEIVSSHDNSFDYDITRIKIGDTLYTSSSDGTSRSDKVDASFPDTEVLCALPDGLNPTHDLTFQRAYKGTLDGVEYTIEEWTYRGGTVTFFCMNGDIAAMKYMEFGALKVTHLSHLRKSADDYLIVKPS